MYDDILNFFMQRRSIRSYQNRPVEDEKLDVLLKAAMSAPTACNTQPWEFIVITDPELLSAMREGLLMGRYNAPCAIVVCGNMKLARGFERTWMQDCSAAIQNILLAATALGLGSVWIGVVDPSPIKAVTKVMNLPEYVKPMGIAYVGYPAETKEPRTQYNEKRVYRNIYDQERKHRARPKDLKHL